MIRRHLRGSGLAAALALVLGLGFGLAARADEPPSNPNAPNQGTGQKAGSTLDNALETIKRGAREAGESIQQQYHRAKTAVHSMGVSGRIYSRLHWDKDLQGSKIDIDVDEQGAATLTGTVPDTKGRTKAVELARDTVGVNSVVDKLTIQPASASDTEKTTTTTPSGSTTVTKETKTEHRSPSGSGSTTVTKETQVKP